MKMQLVDRNRYWSFTTDANGRFELDSLPPDRYRLGIRDGAHRTITLAPGEEREILFDQGRDELEVVLLEHGEPIHPLTRVRVYAVDPNSPDFGISVSGHAEGPGRFRCARLRGQCLVSWRANPKTTSSSFAVIENTAVGDVVEASLSEVELSIETQPAGRHLPPPRASLIRLHGVDLTLYEIMVRELVGERGPRGEWIFQGIPRGAEVHLAGLGSNSGSVSKNVGVDRDGRTVVSWP
jgi:hypothetical protein